MDEWKVKFSSLKQASFLLILNTNSNLNSSLNSTYISNSAQFNFYRKGLNTKFLRVGQYRVVKNAMINSYENGRWRVLDFDTRVKSIRLSWFKRLYAPGWEWYFTYLLKPVGGLFLLPCNNDPNDQISSMPSWYSSGLSLGTPSLIRKIKAQLHMSGCLKMVLKNWIPALSRRFFSVQR